MKGQRTTLPIRLRSRRGLLSPVVLAAAAGLASPAFGQLQGAHVAHGSATFTQNGNTTIVNASNNAIINYQSFNIAGGTTVRFDLPNSHSRVLNRVLGSDPSTIAGSLRSNGMVYIVNPAGVFFAHGALVDVGGIYAAAGHMSNSDFISGANRFTGLSGSVENRGTITGSAVSLLGAHVANFGSIVAPEGMVALAAGNDVLIGERRGNFYAKISGGAPQAGGTGVSNSGEITASGGQVLIGAGDMYAVAIDHSGTTTAKDIRLEGGQGGVVSVSGTLDASNASGHGGTVRVLGDKVGLFGAHVDASGATGGGTVMVGGGARGQGPERNATATYVSQDSTVWADATQQGDGGTVIVWSEMVSRVFGHISARGGASGGDGGFVETSGHLDLQISGTPQVTASHGKGGTWLIDPEDLDIVNTATTGTINQNGSVFTSTGPGAQLFVGDLEAALTGGANVQVVTGATGSPTGGTITLQAGVTLDFNGTGTNTLSLIAHRHVIIDGDILDSTPGGDVLNLVLTANSAGGGTGDVTINGTVNTGGGTLTTSGVNFVLGSTGSIATGGGTIAIGGTGNISLGADIDAGAGSMSFARPVVLTADVTLSGHGVTFDSTLNSDGTPRNLTVDTTGTGDTVFQGAVGGASPLGTLTTNADGRTLFGVLNSASVGVVGATLDFADPVVLNADTTFTATTAATFESDVSGAFRNLTVNSPLTTFDGFVGATGAGAGFASVHTDDVGTTTFNGTSIVANTIDLRDAVVLGDDMIVRAVTTSFGKTVNSAPTEHNDLTISSGTASFAGAVGGVDSLGLLKVTSGATSLGAGTVAADIVNFGGPVTLAVDSNTVTATTSATFGGEIDSSGHARDLIVNSPLTTFAGRIGSRAALGVLRTDSAGTTTLAMGSVGGPSIDAATVDLQDTLLLSLNTSIHGSTAITLAGTVDSAQGSPPVDLILSSPATSLAGEIGGTRGLRNLITQSGGTTTINASDVTADAIEFRDNVILGGDTTLVGHTSVKVRGTLNSENGEANDLTINSTTTSITGAIGQGTGGALGAFTTDTLGTTTLGGTIKAATILFNDSVAVAADSTMNGTTSVVFAHRVDGVTGQHGTLTVDSPVSSFNGPVGSSVAVGGLATTSAGKTIIATPTVKADQIDFANAVVLNQATTFTGTTSLKFEGTLNSANGIGADLTVVSPATTFSGVVGGAPGGVLGAVTTGSTGTTTISANFTAASINFTDTGSLGATITTTGDQNYADVTVSGDSILAGRNITFTGAVDSTPTAHSLTINTSGNGITKFNSPVGNNHPLSALTTNADGLTILAGGAVKTVGVQTYVDAVQLGLSTTVTGTSINFDSTVDSDSIPRTLTVNTIDTGTVTFAAAVGGIHALDRLVTNSDGTANINGATVTTNGSQVYNGAVVLGADTTLAGGTITFGGTLNSNGTPHALVVNTVNNGVTAFFGAVGSTSQLTTITTNHDGKTRLLAPSISVSGSTTFNDAVTVGANCAISAPAMTFNSTIDGEVAGGPSGLTLNSSTLGVTTLVGRIGGTIPLTSLITNADGKTLISADITTAGSMAFNDAVTLKHDVTLADQGATGIAFGSTIDSDSTPRALTLIPNSSSNATEASPTLSRVVFTGGVGSFFPLASLTIGGPRTTNAEVATVVAGLNSSGSVIPNYVLTIATNGAFTMVQGQKFSVLGDLTINSGGRATLSDISTLGSMTINAPSIAIQTRPGGSEFFASGTSVQLGRDGGVDFVAGGAITFSATPTVLGSFTPPAFATPDALGISSNVSQFAQRAVGTITVDTMFEANTVLDLAAAGATNINLAEALPGPAGGVTGAERIAPPPGLNSHQAAILSDAGVDPRLVEVRQLPIAAVRQFVEAYEAFFWHATIDASGQPVRQPQAEHIRQVLGAAWDEYAAAAKGKADPLGFRAYVEAVPTQTEARYDLDALRTLFDRLGQLGLPPGETTDVRRGVLARITPANLTPEQLETAAMATQLGLAPAQEPALAAR